MSGLLESPFPHVCGKKVCLRIYNFRIVSWLLSHKRIWHKLAFVWTPTHVLQHFIIIDMDAKQIGARCQCSQNIDGQCMNNFLLILGFGADFKAVVHYNLWSETHPGFPALSSNNFLKLIMILPGKKHVNLVVILILSSVWP